MEGALFTGLAIGSYVAWQSIDSLMIVIMLIRFKSGDKFLDLYNAVDDDFVFDLMQHMTPSPKSYSQFLLWHQQARPHALHVYNLHMHSAIAHLRSSFQLYVPVPALLFWTSAGWDLLGFIAAHVPLLYYRRFIKHNSLAFYAMFMVSVVIAYDKKII